MVRYREQLNLKSDGNHNYSQVIATDITLHTVIQINLCYSTVIVASFAAEIN